MDNKKYLEYLKSDTWRDKAQERMAIDGFRCVCCGSRGTKNAPLEVHHLSYARNINGTFEFMEVSDEY